MKNILFLALICLALNSHATARSGYAPDILFNVSCTHVNINNNPGGRYDYNDIFGIKFSPDGRTVALLGSQGNSLIVDGIPLDTVTGIAKYTTSTMDVLLKISKGKQHVSLQYRSSTYGGFVTGCSRGNVF